MHMKKIIIFYLSICLLNFLSNVAVAQVPSAQQASGQEGLRQLEEKNKKLQEKLNQKKQEPIQEVLQPTAPTSNKVLESEKIEITRIDFKGNKTIADEDIRKITSPFEGKKLSFADMQKIVDLITDAYRSKGFITSRAILVPQNLKDQILQIQIIEGLMGDLQVKNNHYFKKSLFIKRFSLKKGEIFNYNQVRDDLNLINQYPDRNVKTIITPGQNPGETDVVLEIKDRLPVHVGFAYDNFGSRYIGKNRLTGTLTDNNLLGFDDILSLQYQGTDAARYQLNLLRYLFPVTKMSDLGVYAAKNKVQIGKEFESINARGKSILYGIFLNNNIYNNNNLKVQFNLGMDYKDVFNFQSGAETSRDRIRIAKLAWNVDYMDPFLGRNILNNEVHFGIPNIMSGLDDVDSRSSRIGAGGEFTKDILDYLRLQNLPLEASLLIKFQAQFSSTILPATEQYQLGGISNVRGFASGEAVGDSGESFTSELSLPFYFIPRSLKVPYYSKATFYEALKGAVFYDWGHAKLRNAQSGESKERILDDLGVGIRFTLPENCFLRLDFAWPVTGRPSDGHNEHTWLQITKEF